MRNMRIAWMGLGTLALVLFAFGWYLQDVVRDQLRADLRADLVGLRDALAEALSEWIDTQERAATLAASDSEVRSIALRILTDRVKGTSLRMISSSDDQTELRQELRPALSAWGFSGYLLVHRGQVVAGDDLDWVGATLDGDDYRELTARLRDGGAYLTRPRLLHVGGPAPVPVMWVATPLRVDGRFFGILGFRVDPTTGFSRILETAGAGQSYAFDAQGLLLSKLKEDREVRERGLIAPGTSPTLHLRITVPRPDGPEASAERSSPADAYALTLPVRSARRDITDEDVEGYQDYRGETVVGAWTWFARHGFGMVVEVSRDRAYASSAVIRRSSTSLFVALGLAAAVMLLFARLGSGQLRQRQTLGQYTLERKIGEGGMGTVYLARHALLRRPTAIKMIKATEIDALTRRRFEQEVQATAELCHPNTVAVYDYGQTDEGVFYYAMEYLEGMTLRDLVEKTGALPPERVVNLLIQICSALAEAHAAGLVHRDIKPSNIMLCNRGGVPDFVKVLDFGLVKVPKKTTDEPLTIDTSLTGTPHYIAPEVIVDATDAEPQSDLYALGAMAYYLLTGELLFSGTSVAAILTRHLTESPPLVEEKSPHEVPRRLSRLIDHCLKKEAPERPKSALAMRDELEALAREAGLEWTRQMAFDWWSTHQDLMKHRKEKAITRTITVRMDGRQREEIAGRMDAGPGVLGQARKTSRLRGSADV